MANPYQKAASTTRNAGVLRRRGSIALAGIEDLLAEAGTVRDVTPTMVENFCEQRKIDLSRRLTHGRRQLYHRYLSYCFEDRKLSAEERADLAHLRELLHLSVDDIARVHDDVSMDVHGVYGEAVNEVLDDFRLDDDEAKFSLELRKDLSLSEERAAQIYRVGNRQARSRALGQAESRDRQFIQHGEAAGEFTGRSNLSLEGAIADGLVSTRINSRGCENLALHNDRKRTIHA